MITQADLKCLLRYDNQSGEFFWRIDRGAARTGLKAGTSDGRGYLQIMINKKRYRAHRLAWLYMTGEMPADQIDHINGNRSDNRIENLRAVTGTINKRNQKTPKNNSSGVIGVRWNKKDSRWHARICLDGKFKHLGCFSSKAEAVDARMRANEANHFHANHGRLEGKA